MRTVAALVAAFFLGLAGCTPSSVDPDATVRVTGRALDSQGRPLAGARILLLKEADFGEVIFGSVLALGTLSTICLLPDPPGVCGKAHTATTGDDGRYRFELKGSDTQGTLGSESTLDVVVEGPAAQGNTALSFTAKETAIRLPPARLWRSDPRLSRPEGEIGLSWSPLPPDAGHDVTYAAQLFDESGVPFWSRPASGGEATIDPRLLEDQPGTVAVAADAELSGGRGVGDLRAHFRSRRLPVRATAGPPPSRGRPCAAVTGTAPKAVRPTSPCAATDGDLATDAMLRADKGAVTGVVIDLGSAQAIQLVVARGVAGEFLVEVSDDGRSYQRAGSGSGTAVAVTLTGQPTARFVRLRSPSGLDESLLTEVSVW